MEKYKVVITDTAYTNINNITDYITTVFKDEYLATQIAINIFEEIKKLSYLAPMFQIVDIDALRKKKIRKYRYKKYAIYYELDDANGIVKVLYVRHGLQDENRFFGI